MKEVAMDIRKRRSDRSGRAPLPSPGRPPVAGRDERRRFWAAIAAGMASEDAAIEAGVSQAVGTRWFRKAGGMPPAMFGSVGKAALRAVSLVCGAGGDRASSRAGLFHAGDRSPARAGGIDDLAGVAPQRCHPKWRSGVSCDDGAVARRAIGSSPEAGEACAQRGIAHLCGGTTGWRCRRLRAGLPVPGPAVSWKGRRHGPRQDRRWARAWSPEQIARRLPVDFPDDETMRISHEAIYQALFVQGRGALRRELTACLRTGRALRMPRARTRRRGKTFISPEIMISQRPAEAADRAVPGHWEGDLILGLGSSAIGTLVERTTRFTMLLHLPRMAGHGNAPRARTDPRSPAMAPRRFATPSRARSSPCPSNCDGR